MNEPLRVDRRTTIKWVLAASATLPLMKPGAVAAADPAAVGYGTDPDLTKIYKPGELWPLTFTAPQRRTAAALCDVIIPADAVSPSASAVGVVDFIDEWISAPYPAQQSDRKTLLWGLEWLDTQAQRRFARAFADLEEAQITAICGEICHVPRAPAELAPAAEFFAKYRDLTAGGFYTTPAGTRDLQYVGNVPLARFDGPPPEVLRKVGVTQEPA